MDAFIILSRETTTLATVSLAPIIARTKALILQIPHTNSETLLTHFLIHVSEMKFSSSNPKKYLTNE